METVAPPSLDLESPELETWCAKRLQTMAEIEAVLSSQLVLARRHPGAVPLSRS